MRKFKNLFIGYRKDLDLRTRVRIIYLELKERAYALFGKEQCFECRWGIARPSNEITLKGHIGVIGLRCNRCEKAHNLREGANNE